MKGIMVRVAILAMTCMAAFSQKLLIETDTQEGQLLEQIDAESNEVKKLALLEQFSKLFPNHEAMTWVLSNIQTAYLGQKQYDKVMQAGVKILSLDADDVAAAHNCLRAAEGLKDVELIKRWATQASAVAKRVMNLKKPEEAEDAEDWKQKIEYAKQVDSYVEYALYFTALQSKDTKIKANLVEALEQKNPKSEYLAQMRTSQTQVVRQVDIEEAVAAAEASFKQGKYNEDLLMMVANHYMQKRRETEKIISYSAKLVEILSSKSKPDDISDVEWDKKKRNMLGAAHWMMGLLFSTQEKFAQADRSLRAALPYLSNTDMVAGALYHLGYVNFRIAEAGERIRIHDAVKFTEQCVAIPSAVQRQAQENLRSMKAEYNLQ